MNEREFVYQARQAVYGLLQRLYYDRPDEALFDWLTTERPFAQFPVMLPAEYDADLRLVDEAVQQLSLEDLRQDYRQLYVGPGRMPVPPWESVYRNEERTMFDVHTLQVRETYARHGMEFIKKNKTPEDHVAIELEFMRVLTERLLTTLERGDEKAEHILLQEQRQFLTGHMLAWLPELSKRTQEFAQTDFYRGLAGVLIGFLRWDRDMLTQLLDVVTSEPLPSEA
ncbi:MAG: molecular chaperone TorD family protein [Anaerolineae bacterium]|nr:molecular chaperone TorD family protein [Anaerolineae bacterium]